ncbi:MAG: sulfite exporter TauE/SafE family protein [Mycobacteriaceae bacterium]|nr:sulfite exporter TauE/SafE family protein [Mycobacteriaceae bacterium]
MASLTVGELVVIAGAGVLGGAGNAAAGGGSMLTFPILVAFGIPPLTANVTNTLGHAPGYVSIVVGLREELVGQRRMMLLLIPLAAVGAVGGAALLSLSSQKTFGVVAPYLVLLGCALLALQPWLRGRIAHRPGGTAPLPILVGGVLVGCGYAAYFGAGSGFIVLGTLAITIAADLRTLNALSRLSICVANFVALPVLVLLNPVAMSAAATMWPATLIGGYVGARVARRVPELLFRVLILVLGLGGAAYLLCRQ